MLLGLRSLFEGIPGPPPPPPPTVSGGATSGFLPPWERLTITPQRDLGPLSRGNLIDVKDQSLRGLEKLVGVNQAKELRRRLTDDELALILILAADELL